MAPRQSGREESRICGEVVVEVLAPPPPRRRAAVPRQVAALPPGGVAAFSQGAINPEYNIPGYMNVVGGDIEYGLCLVASFFFFSGISRRVSYPKRFTTAVGMLAFFFCKLRAENGSSLQATVFKRREQRLKTTLAWTFTGERIEIDEALRIEAEVDARLPTLGVDCPLCERLQRWHQGAEDCCSQLTDLDLATQTAKGERPKGSTPEMRHTAPTKPQNFNEPRKTV